MQENIAYINSQLSRIHAHFRQLRNGEVVDNLATQGITYRIAWGLESYRLKEIASEFEQSAELAEALWAEDVRESKMLATRLFPIAEFSQEMALQWIKEAKYTEIADQLCMNLLAKCPYAESLLESLVNEDNIENYCALKLATRIELRSEHLVNNANKVLSSDKAPIYLKTAAFWYKQLFEQK